MFEWDFTFRLVSFLGEDCCIFFNNLQRRGCTPKLVLCFQTVPWHGIVTRSHPANQHGISIGHCQYSIYIRKNVFQTPWILGCQGLSWKLGINLQFQTSEFAVWCSAWRTNNHWWTVRSELWWAMVVIHIPNISQQWEPVGAANWVSYSAGFPDEKSTGHHWTMEAEMPHPFKQEIDMHMLKNLILPLQLCMVQSKPSSAILV